MHTAFAIDTQQGEVVTSGSSSLSLCQLPVTAWPETAGFHADSSMLEAPAVECARMTCSERAEVLREWCDILADFWTVRRPREALHVVLEVP